MADRGALLRAGSGTAGHLRDGLFARPPRPVPGSRIVRKPFHPEEIVRMIRELGEAVGLAALLAAEP